jgi:hypothetical protein
MDENNDILLRKFYDICTNEVYVGGEYEERLKKLPLYRALCTIYDDVDVVIKTAEKHYDIDRWFFWAIRKVWNNMVEDRRRLQQITDPTAKPKMESVELEFARMTTGLQIYYQLRVPEYIKKHGEESYKSSILEFLKEVLG